MKMGVKKGRVFKRLIWRIVHKMESDSFLTVANLQSEKHGSKTMETPLYPGATDGVRRLQQARYFPRATTHHIPHRSFSEPARQYCKALLSFSFYITKPGAVNEENMPCVLYRMCGRGVGNGAAG